MLGNINRLYIHVPFCKSKCAYCTFHSISSSNHSNVLIEQFLLKLEEDIKANSHLTSPLQSIFVGGGTPSFLSVNNLEKLFALISDNFNISENAEISIECNPGSLTQEKIKVISNFANRISLGVQSFCKKKLAVLGRSEPESWHIADIIGSFVNNNINNISIDLIYGIPTQTTDDWVIELKTALKLPIKHLSAYALTLEEGSKLYEDHSTSDESDLTAEMYQITSEILLPELSRYEISNYAKPGCECKHNLDVWFGGKYLGLGPTASSFDGKTRWTQKTIRQWLTGGKPHIDKLGWNKRINEIFIMGLRTTHGWKIEQKGKEILLKPVTSNNSFQIEEQNWQSLRKKLNGLQKENFIEKNQLRNEVEIFPTQKGLLFWNHLAMELLP